MIAYFENPRRTLWLLVASGLLFFLVLLANGVLPGMVGSSASAFVVEGRMRCLTQAGLSALSLRCETLGHPFGYPVLTGGPLVAMGAFLMLIPGVGSGGAYLASGAFVLSVALTGGYALMRRLGARPFVALGTAAFFLISPTVLGMRGFGGTYFGFALLPAYAFADIAVGDLLKRGGTRALVAGFGILVMVRIMALFMDGYSFVASGLVGLLLWFDWAFRSPDRSKSRRWAGLLIFLTANLSAVLLYSLHAPADYAEAPLGLFRSMGLDVVTLWLPGGSLWLASELGWGTNHSSLWGDGTNANFNYVGFACLALALLFFAVKPRNSRAMALFAAGVLAFILSLGPAFKVGEERPPVEGIPTIESYLMPHDVAPELPWGWLFTEVPGLSSMRASYRWFGVTRMVLIVLAGLAVGKMIRRNGPRRWVAAALAVVAVVELAPDLVGSVSRHRDNRRQMDLVSEQVETELRVVTRQDQRAFFLNYDGSHNDWLANYLGPAAGLVTYNAGGDKNAAMSSKRWPEEVTALASRAVTPDDIARSLRLGSVDVVVLPFFHLRYSAYSWPPSEEQQRAAYETFKEILADERFYVETGQWLAAVTLES